MPLLKLSKKHLKEIFEDGETFVDLPNGGVQRMTTDDLVFKKAEIDEYLAKTRPH